MKRLNVRQRIKRDKKIAQRKRNIIMTIKMMAIFVLTAVAQPQTNNIAPFAPMHI